MSASAGSLERADRPLQSATTPPHTRPAIEFALGGVVIALIFGVGLILPIPFWRAQPASPLGAGEPSASGLGWPAALLAIGFALVLCAPYRPYVLAVRAAQHVSLRVVLGVTAALALVALLIYPAFGSDLFVYLDYERLFTVYGANPLLAFPNLQPGDWAYRFTWIPEQPSPYGPLWPLLTWPIAATAADNLWGWIAGYKLLALISYIGCGWLIWISVEADRRKRALVTFAWSPLVLFDLLGKAHNDGLLAVAALAAIWLARRSGTAGWLAATLGMLIKLSGFAVVLALAINAMRQRRWKTLTLGTLGCISLSALLYAPFWTGPRTLEPLLFQTNRVVWSPGALLIFLGVDGLLARAVCAIAWVAICLLVVRRTSRLPHLVWAIQLATLMLLTTAFFAHYLVPIVALAAVSGDARLERFTLALSIGALAAYSVELLGPALDAGWIGSRGYQGLGSLVTLGPAALLLSAQVGRSFLPRRQAPRPQP